MVNNMEKKFEYHLCDPRILELTETKEVSKTLDRFGSEVCIALLEFNELNENYSKLEENDELASSWCREIVLSNTSCETFTIEDAKEQGLFNWIIDNIGVSTEKNVAAIIGQICDEQNMTPIELFNKVN